MPLSGGKRGPSEVRKKEWSWRMKFALYCLAQNAALQTTQRTALFRTIFPEETSAWAVTDDRLRYLIRAQLSEAKKQRMEIWKHIYRPATEPVDIANRKAIRARIQEAIATMNHPLAVPAILDMPVAATGTRAVRPATGTTSTARNITGNGESSTNRVRRSARRTVSGNSLQPADVSPTPLSRRAAIGVWCPEVMDELIEKAAPSPKRRRTASFHVSDGPLFSQASRAHCTTTVSTSLATPQKQKRLMEPKVAFQQAHGTVIQWTPEKIAKAQQDLPEVLATEAHPSMNGLLFRYWNEDPSEPRNTRNGFIARKYVKAKVNFNQPPPLCNKLDWEEVFYHIDRSGKAIEWPSIFVSTSNSLLWTLQKALKELKSHPDTLQISVIDANALNPKSVYHVHPYQQRLKSKGEFTHGSWRYVGTHEFLVHKRIPGEAIIHTFALRDLLRFVKHDQDAYDPIIERILRIETLGAREDLKNSIHPQLKKDNIPLSAVVAIGVAKLTSFAGIRSDSETEHIQAITAEIVQGWALQLKRQSPEQWSTLASSYANALFEYSHRPRSFKEEMLVKRAFLGGVFWGSSKHFNPRQSPERVRSTYRSAKEIGLEDPGKMTMDEVGALQMSLMMFEKKQQRRLPGHRTQLLLEHDDVSDEGFPPAEEMGDEQDASDVDCFLTSKHSVSGGRRRWMADDTNDDIEDENIIYE